MFESNDYRFYRYQYSTYHHTDVSRGADIHYLALLIKGSAKFRTDRETIHITCGDIFYIPRGLCYHSFWQGAPEIAKACGVSQPHLFARFRQETSYSPNRYRQQILCERAMELLTTTDLTVQAISEQLHFSSPSYFRKVFFRYTGQTPRQFAAHKIKSGTDA